MMLTSPMGCDMRQKTFAEAEYDAKKRKTRREKFLERMEELIPWKRLQKRIVPFLRQGRAWP